MLERKKEIYIRLDNPKEISEILKEISKEIEETKKLFSLYDKLNLEENKLFDNWSNYIEEISEKVDHITL